MACARERDKPPTGGPRQRLALGVRPNQVAVPVDHERWAAHALAGLAEALRSAAHADSSRRVGERLRLGVEPPVDPVLDLLGRVRLVHALALGGGLTDFASRGSIYVVRSEPKPIRIRFTMDSITRNIGGAGDFPLHRGDTVEVE